MINSTQTTMEEKVRQATLVPEPRLEFTSELWQQISSRRRKRFTSQHSLTALLTRPASVIPLALLVFIVCLLIAVGPQRVIAAVRGLLGYIPGVGIVEQGAPIRVLADPVTVTRDEISITVTSATLSADKTHIEYRIFGVPGSAYPDREDMIGCTTPEYLRLPGGTQLTRKGNDFEPVPAGIDAATFVIPCIFSTLPGKTPENWELSLRFVPAPPDFTVMPVIDLSPSPQASLIPKATTQPEALGITPTSTVDNEITIIKEIATSDGYILVGQFPFNGLSRDKVTNGEGEIRDKNGKKVDYTHPQDIGPNELGLEPDGPYWFMQFEAAGLAYPLTISYSGFTARQPEPGSSAEFTFDAGSNPQPGQEWTPDQDIQLAGHTLKLLSITADSRNGYDFRLQGDPDLVNVDIEILSHTTAGWGGSGSFVNGVFDRHVSYVQVPSGVLTVRLYNLIVNGDPIRWEGQWSPAVLRTDLPADPTPQPGVCLTTDTIGQLHSALAELTNGKVLVYEPLEDGNSWGLVLHNLDGSQKQVVTSTGNWGALSPDGKKVVYSGLDNSIHIVDLDLQTDQILPNAYGFDLHWSPDGTRIAFVYLNGSIIDSVFIVNADGTALRQISDLSYESVVGWSPDGSKVYFVAPFTGGSAWKVYSFEVARDVVQELFTIENGTPKFLNPKLSPNGTWIAYRGKDNSSLYLVHPDGSDMHLVLDNIGVVGIEWSSTGWLGVSLSDQNSTDETIVLVKPDDCGAYKVPYTVQGDLEGLFIP